MVWIWINCRCKVHSRRGKGRERFEVGEEVSTVDMGSGKSLPDWGNGNCKGLGMEAYLACTDGVVGVERAGKKS